MREGKKTGFMKSQALGTPTGAYPPMSTTIINQSSDPPKEVEVEGRELNLPVPHSASVYRTKGEKVRKLPDPHSKKRGGGGIGGREIIARIRKRTGRRE